MFRNRRSPVAILKEWRLPREQRAQAREARQQAKFDADVHGRAARVEAEARRHSNHQGGCF